ncbi:MAG: hypothetical protein WCO58_02440 [bacterium]
MNKTIKIIAIIVFLAGGGYLAYFYFGINQSNVSSGEAAPSASTEEINQKFVQSLAGISTIVLDKNIFSNPAFASLVDYSNPLVPEPTIGRNDPFLPIGSDDTSVSSDAPVVDTTNTTTGTPNKLPAKRNQ